MWVGLSGGASNVYVPFYAGIAKLLSALQLDPVAARKTVAKLQWATSSDRPIVLNYDPRMGHAGGRTPSKQLRDAAWEMAFLNWQLGVKEPE